MRPQTGRAPGHPKKAAEGERDCPKQGQATSCAAAAAPGRTPHPGRRGGAPAAGGKVWGAGRRDAAVRARRPHRARAPILAPLRTVSSGSCGPWRPAPPRIRNIAGWPLGGAQDAPPGRGGARGGAGPERQPRGSRRGSAQGTWGRRSEGQGSSGSEDSPRVAGERASVRNGVGSGDPAPGASRRVLAATCPPGR